MTVIPSAAPTETVNQRHQLLNVVSALGEFISLERALISTYKAFNMSERASLEQSLTRTELKISVFQGVLSEADNTRVQLRMAINRTALIAILPVDVKLEIFLYVYHDVLPLVLGAVCKEWRDIVWNSPQLWDTIDLVLSQDHYKTQLILLKDWLERGGRCPLSITLHYIGFFAMHTKYPELACLPLLFGQSYRWEHIDFRLPRGTIVGMMREPGYLPLLRSLFFDFDLHDEWYQDNRGHLRYFAEAPLLRSANTNNRDLADIVLPWKQLEDLKLRSFDVDYLCRTLEQARNLVHCHLESSCRHDLPDKRVHLPKLQSITLEDRARSLLYSSVQEILNFPDLRLFLSIIMVFYCDTSVSLC